MFYAYIQAFWFYLIFSVFAVFGLIFLKKWTENFKIAYTASKPLGFLIFGYAVWLFSSFQILDFQNKFLIDFLLVFCLALSLRYLIRNWPENWRQKNIFFDFILAEAWWLLVYFAYLWLRSHNAAIYGTERFMDMAFMKASSVTNYFPPEDPWRAGYFINYYYYGHYLLSFITNISGISATLTYAFSLGIIFSSAITLSWAFVRNFSRSVIFTFLAAFFVATAGTAAYAVCVINAPPGDICNYAKSTRLYEPSYIINEIPSYSFTVGDLHAHLIALPFFILALILLYFIYKAEKINLAQSGILALVMASSGMINLWDFITLAMLAAFVAAFKPDPKNTLKIFLAGALAVILMLPFVSNFTSAAQGIGFAPSFAKEHGLSSAQQYPTPIFGWMGLWGIFLAAAGFCAAILRRSADKIKFPLFLAAGAVFLLAGVEIFFVKDIYFLANPPYFRANSVFKFGFHSWVLLALSAAVLSAKFFEQPSGKIKKLFYAIFLFFAFVAGLFYPYQAIKQFYLAETSPRTLDGMVFLKTLHPDDFETINWLHKNASQRSVLIEAAGNSYTDYGRIGVFSGMTNPVNWLTHEWGWRFQPEEKPANSEATQESGWSKIAAASGEVRQIYEAGDILLTRDLLIKYRAKFVYIGDIEKKEYPNIFEEKFYKLGHIVFSSGSSKLFQIDI